MKVMETAKIMAASTQLRPCIPFPLKALPSTFPLPKTPTGRSGEREALVVQKLTLAPTRLIPDILANAVGPLVVDGAPSRVRSFTQRGGARATTQDRRTGRVRDRRSAVAGPRGRRLAGDGFGRDAATRCPELSHVPRGQRLEHAHRRPARE